MTHSLAPSISRTTGGPDPGPAPQLRRVLLASPVATDPARLGRLSDPRRGPLVVTAPTIEAALGNLREGTWYAILVAAECFHAEGGVALGAFIEAAPRTPVLVLASREGDVEVSEAVRHGAHDLLVRAELTRERLERALAWAHERARSMAELRDQAHIDPLTGLYNRRGFMAVAETHRRLLVRSGRHALLVYADMTGLKRVNDRHGHAVGDRAIIAAADGLRVALRQSDVIARNAGDEFVAIVHDADELAAASLIARIDAAVEDQRVQDGLPEGVALSVGFARFADTSRTLEQALLDADRSLYHEKQRLRRRRDRPARD